MFPFQNIMLYVLLYLNLVCVELAYLENSAISKWFSFSLLSFTTACVEVKSCIEKMIVESKEWTKTAISADILRQDICFYFLHIGKNVI